MTTRDSLTSEQRSTSLIHTIDPGFVHHRKIETILGPSNMMIVDERIKSLPDLPEWQRRVRIDHIYTQALLIVCNKTEIRPLQDILATRTGHMFCSTERLLPCPDIYDIERAVSVWAGNYLRQVEFHYSTRHIASETLRSRLYSGEIFSIVALLHSIDDSKVIFDPLVMGFPWLEAGEAKPNFDIMWFGYDFFENFVEDFDEFSKVNDIPVPPNSEPMKDISELAFKKCLAKMLGDSSNKDWGGEASDYYSAHLHMKGQRLKAAFLLKGPHDFRPMSLNHLGKNNDQIVRLSHEPANILFVQHCHDISPPVRETLRAFAVQPSNPRRFCLIDGRDSLRLLYAYNMYEEALSITKEKNS